VSIPPRSFPDAVPAARPLLRQLSTVAHLSHSAKGDSTRCEPFSSWCLLSRGSPEPPRPGADHRSPGEQSERPAISSRAGSSETSCGGRSFGCSSDSGEISRVGSGPNASTVQAVVFDLYGTLVDTNDARVEAWLAVFGYHVPRERILPERSVMVGDTRHDGEASARAGVPFLGLLCGGRPPEELSRVGALSFYADPADLLARLQVHLASRVSR
jgi:hypothetical protein